MKQNYTRPTLNLKTDFMKMIYAAVMLVFCVSFVNAQTTFTLIDPNGDGGFETSATQFPSNGWTAVQAATNRWNVGTATGAFTAGVRGAYITNAATLAASAANTYNNGTANTSHIYRSIAIPAGATNVTLTF